MEVTVHGDKLGESRRRVDAAKCRTPVGAGIPIAGCASARRADGDGQPEWRGRPGFLPAITGERTKISGGDHIRIAARRHVTDVRNNRRAEAGFQNALNFPDSRACPRLRGVGVARQQGLHGDAERS